MVRKEMATKGTKEEGRRKVYDPAIDIDDEVSPSFVESRTRVK